MCCFSRPVKSVRGTSIFARSSAEGRQMLAYSATLEASEELAMVLPLPTPPGVAEDAVRFINLSGYPSLFGALEEGFPEPTPLRMPSLMKSARTPPPPEPLEVVQVGSFIASFVPTIADFARLDPKFQLPEGTWEKLPAYRDHSFAVFALSPGQQRLHPLAFEFPRKDPRRLFFPTVHIHDGQVREAAYFDHALYCQELRGERLPLSDWEESNRPAAHFVDLAKAQGLVVNLHCYKKVLKGRLPNQDTYV